MTEEVRTVIGDMGGAAEISTELHDDHVAEVIFSRPPHNYFDVDLISAIADALDGLASRDCRAVVLASAGKHFCAGASLSPDSVGSPETAHRLYAHGLRIFEQPIPVVVAVQGSATGGGAGLALAGDFRVGTPSTCFWVNFAQLGFHPGFGVSVTLPKVVGQQNALDILYTGRKVKGEEARRMGLLDRVAAEGELLAKAHAMAAQIAQAAPLAVRSIRATQRRTLVAAVREMVIHEANEQARLRPTADCLEGLLAAAERREPRFVCG
jgi:2-(1,2-epoxy-1,2-dihydrophenyl)acetyl-CoA isomerase